MSSLDAFGEPVAGTDASVAAWDRAWTDLLHFVGDPFDRLAQANEHDDAFALGSVFRATYGILGGAPLDSLEISHNVERATMRAQADRERGHVEALTELAAGNFTKAGERWDEVAADGCDLAAVRFAHDVYLHVGDADRRLRSSGRAAERFAENRAHAYVLGQYAFALEEAGHYDEAERVGWESLEVNELDLWAMHALAHVYESTEDQEAALRLLASREETWTVQDSLAVHIHWHRGLRLIAGGDFDEVLRLHDDLVPIATTPFRLCDLASLLWRLELNSVDVGDRWRHMANAFAERPERHTTGLIDLHMALAFTRVGDHPAAREFFDDVADSHAEDGSENGDTFRTVVDPLVQAIRHSVTDPVAAAASLAHLGSDAHRIGGSIAQRDLISLTQQWLSEP